MYKLVRLFFYLASFTAFGAGVMLLRDISHAVNDPAAYQFGSVSMLAQWGQAYASLPAYVDSTLKTAGMFFFCSVLLACFGSIPFFLKNQSRETS